MVRFSPNRHRRAFARQDYPVAMIKNRGGDGVSGIVVSNSQTGYFKKGR
jgi:hypothetical protein